MRSGGPTERSSTSTRRCVACSAGSATTSPSRPSSRSHIPTIVSKCAIGCSLESGAFETFVRETTFRHADGTEVAARFHVGATRAADGSIAYLVAHAEDITESRRTEAALALSEDRFRAASEASLDSLILMDAVRDAAGEIVDFTITAANTNAASMFGFPIEAMLGTRIDASFPVSYKNALLQRYRRVVETGVPELAEYAAGDPSVRVLWIREQVVKVDDGIALTSSDISDQKRAEIALRESEERYRALMEHAVDVVCIIDAGAYIRYASPAVREVLGYTPEEFCGLHPFDLIHSEDLESWLERWHAIAGRTDGRFSLEVRALHRDGGYRWMDVNVRDLRHDPHIAGFVAHFHDVGDRREAQQALLHQSLHDGLTGLPNRALLLDRLAHAFDRSRRRTQSVAVLFLDVDHFKAVNDSLGHAVGDALLREVADRLTATVRPEDSVARFGGDEFVICCEELEDVDAAIAMAERVRDAFAPPFTPNGHTVSVGTSIGVALASEATETPEAVLRDADAAMYVAKARGRDRYVVYDDALRTRVLEHLDTEAGLRDALDQGALVVHWQPVYNLHTQSIAGLEALVRWRHDERGLLLPAEFLDAAMLARLDAPLGDFVLDTACAQFRVWDDLGIAPPVIWLNLSPGQLTWTGTVERVKHALTKFAIDPTRIGFDISEQAIADIDRARRASAELAGLRALGCAIAIDDFGTGHASPLAVRRYGITHVKLDRTLVQTAADGDPMLPALMSLATMLGVTVLAEGIETPDQMDRILAAGCDTATGNFLAPAASEAETTALLAAAAFARRQLDQSA
ncbi:MAG: EAL domain-containing protein [Acidimicrobiia bacterium]|nr:EAL domain-containing protein [Acidimicrobiia bacterium]